MNATRYKILVDHLDASGVNATVPAGEIIETTGGMVYLSANYLWLVVPAVEVESCKAKYAFVETVQTVDYKVALAGLRDKWSKDPSLAPAVSDVQALLNPAVK